MCFDAHDTHVTNSCPARLEASAEDYRRYHHTMSDSTRAYVRNHAFETILNGELHFMPPALEHAFDQGKANEHPSSYHCRSNFSFQDALA